MFTALLYMFVGAFIAWFFLPAPQVVVDLRNWLFSKVPLLGSFAKKD
jgi:hypothetical protein